MPVSDEACRTLEGLSLHCEKGGIPSEVWQRGDLIGRAFLKDRAGCSITNGLRRSKDGSRRVTQATAVIREQDGGGG